MKYFSPNDVLKHITKKKYAFVVDIDFDGNMYQMYHMDQPDKIFEIDWWACSSLYDYANLKEILDAEEN